MIFLINHNISFENKKNNIGINNENRIENHVFIHLFAIKSQEFANTDNKKTHISVWFTKCNFSHQHIWSNIVWIVSSLFSSSVFVWFFIIINNLY